MTTLNFTLRWSCSVLGSCATHLNPVRNDDSTNRNSRRTFTKSQRVSVDRVREASTTIPEPGIARIPFTPPDRTSMVWSASVISYSTPTASNSCASSPAGAFHTPRASVIRA